MSNEKHFQEIRYTENTIQFKKWKFKKIIHFISNEASGNLQTDFFLGFDKANQWKNVSTYIKN